MTVSENARREAAELRAHALTALRQGDVDTARELVRQSDLLDPPRRHGHAGAPRGSTRC